MGVLKTKGHYIPTLITEKLTTHSAKPRLFYTILKDRTLEPRIDIFARKRHEGFEAWGNEVEKGLQLSLMKEVNPASKRGGGG
jgi:N6-adenosine-specific RNA methylase IME4